MLSNLLSYITSFFSSKNDCDDDDDDDNSREEFLAEQLLDLETCRSNENEGNFNNHPYNTAPNIPRDSTCLQRTGVITYLDKDYVLIDGMLYFDLSACSINLNINDKVLYLCYKDANDSVIVVRILENHGLFWGDEEDMEENSYQVIDHVIVGEVGSRSDRNVYMKDSDLKFSLNEVDGTFVPTKGDWLELRCTIQFDEDKPSDVSAQQVLQVISFKALRRIVKSAVITDWFDESGICDRHIYFHKHTLDNGIDPRIGLKVMVEAIESNQGTCTWRVIKLISIDNTTSTVSTVPKIEDSTLELEKKKCIEMTHPINIKADFQKTASMLVNITNNSDEIYVINKWIVLSKKRDSQIDIKPFISRPIKLYPKQTFNLTVTCFPKFLGSAKECLIVMFRGFQLKRFIQLNIVESKLNMEVRSNGNNYKSEYQKIDIMKNIRTKVDNTFVPGVRVVKPPAFVPVKLGMFPIPEKIWSVMLEVAEQAVCSSELNTVLEKLETSLPCLSQELNINNYIDKWHTLLHMEEVEANISMRVHDTPKAFLIRCQEYLGIELSGLSERRPSLIKGDRVIVKDIWDNKSLSYEGFIHVIRGDLVLMKFSPQFHESYGGTDVSLEFHFSRSTYRRAHQAINQAISNLGADILFPRKIISRNSQIDEEKLKDLEWFNEKLNSGQKAAVTNILLGNGRPLPYCIFGPPGTGKTVTVIETILQILRLQPESRILVATPSNSAANLITERLIENKSALSGSLIRLIANYLLDSDNIPDIIRPYCATLDIAREETSKSKHVIDNGINLHCQTSFIGRHRVTIGTCYCLGTLAQMGLPKGHFTHVIIDEAGQATEPEIMIPMTFVDKESGQIVLAGDPMQLGPVVMSKYCQEFGMDESYLSRLLETFPYHRDYDAFVDGYNNKLITKLNENYRSLIEVLTLPSSMFYDASLVAKFDRNQPWIKNTLNLVSEVFNTSDSETGGIFVYGIRGCNARAEDSPSWYNPQEASMVALTTCKLYKKGLTTDDIGIITPYIAQIKYLRLLFESMGLPQPKIGTVEEFQGQERPVILMSTVRSTEALLKEDQKHTLGFVKSPKRLNVALTRAQLAVLLFCNPHLLKKDPLWSRVIDYAVKADKYVGCDLPFVSDLNNENIEVCQ